MPGQLRNREVRIDPSSRACSAGDEPTARANAASTPSSTWRRKSVPGTPIQTQVSPSVVGITAAGALCQALSCLGVSRLAFSSPYTRQLNEEGANFLTQSGFEVVHCHYIGTDLGNYGQGDLTPEEVCRMNIEERIDLLKANILHYTQDLLGYDVVDTKLVVNEIEADRVRQIFELYLENRSLLSTVKELNRRGWTSVIVDSLSNKRLIPRRRVSTGAMMLAPLLAVTAVCSFVPRLER